MTRLRVALAGISLAVLVSCGGESTSLKVEEIDDAVKAVVELTG